MFDVNIHKVVNSIHRAAEARQRHWNRITRCPPHEFPYRLERIHSLTVELHDLYAEKRRLRVKRG